MKKLFTAILCLMLVSLACGLESKSPKKQLASSTVYSYKQESRLKEMFLIGMLSQTVPPLTWIPGVMSLANARDKNEAMSFYAGMGITAMLQATVLYFVIKGVKACF